MANDKKKIVIASGGTGGHFYPGFSLAKSLRNRNYEVLFMVKKDDISIPHLKDEDFPYIEIDVSALPRSINPIKQLAFMTKLAKALSYCSTVFKDFQPKAVLGTGSYVGFPAVMAAVLKHIPAFIHESNSIPGIGNKVVMRFCKKIALGMPLFENKFPDKTVITGTPIRETFKTVITKDEALKKLSLDKNKFTVLFFGGSQGAARLNNAAISSFLVMNKQVQLIHITGEKNYEKIKSAYAAAKLIDSQNLKLFSYYENMTLLFNAADLVVCRSGASTIAELIQLSKPAILIPLPTAAGNHQKINADVMHKNGSCICLEETDKLFIDLEENILSFINDKTKCGKMAENYLKLEIPKGLEASEKIAELIESNI